MQAAQSFGRSMLTPDNITGEALVDVQTFAECPNMDAEPTLDEVYQAVKVMKNGKSPGSDGLPAEIFKYGGPVLHKRLHTLFTNIWRTECIPQDYKDANIVTIYKRKGDKSDCGNYRGISLLSIAGKIFARILLNRLLQNITDRVQPESQCGFRAKRGTADMIFVARQLQEKCREQHRGLYTVFIDLTKAFDTVSRTGLWQLLRKFGCPQKFTNLVRLLHDGMQCRVSVDGALSEPFPVTNGVKQGCVMGPVLFCLFYAAMLDDATRDLSVGVPIRFRVSGKLFNLGRFRSSTKTLNDLVCELLYADDCALEAESQEDIQFITDRFSAAAKRFGLTINLKKTEVMYQPAPGHPYMAPAVHIDNTQLKPVTEFCYLGSMLSNDVLLDKEIESRVNKASASFGRLFDRVWRQHDIKLDTKLAVYNAVVLSNLLYGCETWTCYRRHIKQLEKFHMRHLRSIMKIKWQDKITNVEVLRRSKSTGIEALLMTAQLRWSGHVVRMGDIRLPKRVFYGELRNGYRSKGGQRKRFKDTLKQTIKQCDIDPENWETVAADRVAWRTAVKSGVSHFEETRLTACDEKRRLRKQQQTVPPPTDAHTCGVCGRVCRSRIGLFSHNRTHLTS